MVAGTRAVREAVLQAAPNQGIRVFAVWIKIYEMDTMEAPVKLARLTGELIMIGKIPIKLCAAISPMPSLCLRLALMCAGLVTKRELLAIHAGQRFHPLLLKKCS